MIRLAAQAAARCGWRVEVLDPFTGHAARIHDGARSVLIGAGASYSYPINPVPAATLARDKAHAAQILSTAGQRVPEGRLFFLHPAYRDLRPAGRELSDAASYAATLGYPVFVKPNTGARGDGAELITDAEALPHHLKTIAARYFAALIQRPVPGAEYRLFVADGRVRFSHRRAGAVLLGDGVQTVRALLEAANAALAAKRLTPVATAPDQNPVLAAGLRAAGLGPGDILAPGQALPYMARGNLSAGGRPEAFSTQHPPAVHIAATAIADALDLRVAGVDVLTTAPLADTAAWTVLEVNANPGLTAPEAVGQPNLAITIMADILTASFAQADAAQAYRTQVDRTQGSPRA